MAATGAEGASWEGPLEDSGPEPRCETCGAPLGPAAAEAEGRCPACGTPTEAEPAEDDDRPVRPPWHFKVLVLGTIGYLVYRLIWFIGWLTHHV